MIDHKIGIPIIFGFIIVCGLMLLLVIIPGCVIYDYYTRYKLCEEIARANPDYYPRLTEKQKIVLISNNLRTGRDPLCGCYIHKSSNKLRK